MILQALCGYYQRARNMPGADLIEPGYSMEKVYAEIVIDREGELVAVNSLLEQQGKKQVPRLMLVPQPPKRSGQRPEAAFLYETVAFIFGIFDKPDGAAYRFEASSEIHHAVLDGCDDDAARAVLQFFDKRTPDQTTYESVDTQILSNTAQFLVFRLSGDDIFVHEHQAVQTAWDSYNAKKSGDADIIQCLITGEQAPLARLHGNISGFGMDKPTLVSFNKDSFCSFGKFGLWGANAPVGERAAFEYVTALNMLMRDRKHRVNLAGDKVLFWAERDAQLEEDTMFSLMDGSLESESDMLDSQQRDRIQTALNSVWRGGDPGAQMFDQSVRFYVLGLSANKTRLVVRFFHESSFGDILNRLGSHYAGLSIDGQRYRYPSPYRILKESALRGEMDNVPPNLESALMRSILDGSPYPPALYQAVLRRVRAGENVTALRAGIIRATINRNQNEEALKMALDQNERDVPYLLGRLFAMIEKSQRDALGEVNASITDKYLNSAMASPQMVFPALIALNERHLAKSEYGYAMQRLKIELIGMLNLQRDQSGSFAFPESLDANGQGKFLVGFYHQIQALYTKKSDKAEQQSEEEA